MSPIQAAFTALLVSLLLLTSCRTAQPPITLTVSAAKVRPGAYTYPPLNLRVGDEVRLSLRREALVVIGGS